VKIGDVSEDGVCQHKKNKTLGDFTSTQAVVKSSFLTGHLLSRAISVPEISFALFNALYLLGHG